MHERSDGLHSGVPTIAIRFDKIIGPDPVYNRTKVSVIMEFRKGDIKTPAEIMVSLKHDSCDNATNEYTFHLSDTNPAIFSMCLTHKYTANISIWNGGPNFNEQKFTLLMINAREGGPPGGGCGF